MPQFLTPLNLEEIPTPANPVAGFVLLYAKADANIYVLDSLGGETAVSTVPQISSGDWHVPANSQMMFFTDITLTGDLYLNGLLQGMN